MKKLGNYFKLLVVVMAMVLLTGCVKYDMTMDITKDDVKVGLIYAMQSSYVDDGDFDDMKEEAKKNGYTVEDYKDDDYIGIKMTKSLGDLKSVSKGNGDEISITELFEEDSKLDTSKLFKLENGVYTANFIFDASSEDSLSGDEASNYITADDDEEDETTDDDTTTDDTTDEDDDYGFSFDTDDDSDDDDDYSYSSDDDTDYSQLLSGVKFKFIVTLPTEATSNNATKVSDDKKTLTWEVAYGSKANVDFSFKLADNTVLYIVIGVAAVIVIAGVIILITKKKKPNMPVNNMTGQVGPAPMPNQPIQPNQPNQTQPIQPNNVNQMGTNQFQNPASQQNPSNLNNNQ